MAPQEQIQKSIEAILGAQLVRIVSLEAEVAALRQQLATMQKPTLVPTPMSTTAPAVGD